MDINITVKEKKVFGIPVAVGERRELYINVKKMLGNGGTVNTVNPEMMSEAVRSEELYRALCSSLNIPDGNLIAKSLRIDGVMTDVYPGVELGDELLTESGVRLGIIGGAAGVAERALLKLYEKHPNITPSFALDGYTSSEDRICDCIASHAPNLVFICTGTPRQQLLGERLHRKFENVLFISLGGSVDVYAGDVRRAPRIFREYGLEWLWRVLREPSRLPRVIRSLSFIMYRQRERCGKLHKTL